MSALKVVPLGGMGKVTQNMFLYIYENEIVILDCGIGFPDHHMPGVDVLIPDTRYVHQLLEEGKQIVGLVLTHGHDDHIGATPYILPEFEMNFPIYGSALTAGFAKNRMKDGGIEPEIIVPEDGAWVQVGTHFEIMPIQITHSVPDTRHYAIKTPEGVIYHGSDFKLDKNPVDGILSDETLISQLGDEGLLCMMIDCLRVERSEWVKSETETRPAIEEAFEGVQGKVVVTLMSSHIHRIQQTVDVAVSHGRKVVFVGRSVEQNVDVALELGKLHIPKGMKVDKRDITNIPDDELCVIIAGSQGQEGSSLMRAVYGEHRIISFKENDIVVFSADAIPGNEIPYFDAIDELCRNGVRVIYPDVSPDIHQSGHASAPEQKHMVELAHPEFVMPIGGADRHRVKFFEVVAQPLGYDTQHVITPESGEVISFENGAVSYQEHFSIAPRYVDGLGVGDVGPRVLSDRKALSEAGMIVILLPRDGSGFDVRNMKIISRGFVFMKEADEVIQFIKETVGNSLQKLGDSVKEADLKRKIERKLARKLYKVIRREPLIVVEILE
jgi:ribonuclease J